MIFLNGPKDNDSISFSRFFLGIKINSYDIDLINLLVEDVLNTVKTLIKENERDLQWGYLTPIRDKKTNIIYLSFELKHMVNRTHRINKMKTLFSCFDKYSFITHWDIIPETEDIQKQRFKLLINNIDYELIQFKDLKY